MNNDVINILTMAKVIQTAVAPVFLITGIAATLGVLSNRLAFYQTAWLVLQTALVN